MAKSGAFRFSIFPNLPVQPERGPILVTERVKPVLGMLTLLACSTPQSSLVSCVARLLLAADGQDKHDVDLCDVPI